jgi:hypothetical protein
VVNVIDSTGISRDGDLLKLSFNVTGAKGTSSPIGITSKGLRNMDKNEIPATMMGGKVTVTGAGAGAPLPVFIPVIAAGFALVVYCRYRRFGM